jgi:phosphoribosylaminoimidazole-succinocarboxamide synthase
VDTKYEFGLFKDEPTLIDEIHTPDSSRFFYADTYEKLQSEGLQQRQLSKEFVREWLMQNGFQGLEGQLVPEMTDEFVDSISGRYQELYEVMLGKPLVKRSYENILENIEQNINLGITHL